MELNEMLMNEIESEFAALEELNFDSETYKTAVDGVVKLVDRAIELEKIRVDIDEKARTREVELKKLQQIKEAEQHKVEQSKNDRLDQFIRNGINLASIVIPAVLTVWGTYKTLKFEETGTVTTIMGKGFVNKLVPRK